MGPWLCFVGRGERGRLAMGPGDIAGAGCQSGEHLMLLTAHPQQRQPGRFTHLHTLTLTH